MAFAAPFWLLALLPWAAVVALLLFGRLKRVKVPFLELWKGPEVKPRQRRAIEPPPLALLLAILAMLLAVLAAARPVIQSPQPPAITLIVDRGLSMSARGEGDLRFRETIDWVHEAILQTLGPGPVELLSIPPEGSSLSPNEIRPSGSDVHHPSPALQPILTDRHRWSAIAKAWPGTILETRGAFLRAVLDRLTEGSSSVVAISDHQLPFEDSRLVQVFPQTPIENLGIVHLAVRESPIPQLMVRLRNQSSHIRASLRVFSDEQLQAQSTVTLPSTGEQDYFLDIPKPGQMLHLQLDVEDDLPADNQAWLVRQQAFPILEARASLPPELDRMIDLYRKLRPAGQGSKRVVVVDRFEALPTDEPAVVFTPGTRPLPPNRSLRLVDHPITTAITDWSRSLQQAHIAPLTDEPGWQPVVIAEGQPLVAVRSQPRRQVWVGFFSPIWSTQPDFVLFWTNVFHWLGEGGQVFAAPRVGPLAASSVLDVHLPSPNPSSASWREALGRLAGGAKEVQRSRRFAPALSLAALVALLLAAFTWKSTRSRSQP